MSDELGPTDNDVIGALFKGRPASEARKDPLIGEIVRILVRADTASFAKIYAAAKAEEAAMDAQTEDSLRDLWRRRTRKQGDGNEQAREHDRADDSPEGDGR
jgi:hypothetical protein